MPQPTDDQWREIEAHIPDRKIEAIRLYRLYTNSDLLTAKNAVEAREVGQPIAPVAASSSELNWKSIDDLLHRNQLIHAIKLYRAQTGVGLKEAKDAVEARQRQIGVGGKTSTPGKSSGIGCGAIAVLVGLLVAGVALYFLLR